MSQSVEEQLSALLDNELPVEEEELLFRRLENNPEYRAVLGRYSLMRELIASSDVDPATLQISERVRAVLHDEVIPVESTVQKNIWSGTGNGLFRFGTAAAVAMIAVMAFVSLNYDSGTGQTIAPGGANNIYPSPVIRADRRVIGPGRLTGYLVSHGEFSNPLSRRMIDSHIVARTP